MAQRAHLASRFPGGYLPLGRGTLWTLSGLPIAGAESSPQFPLAGPQASLQSSLVVARLLYLQDKVKQQKSPLIGRILHPPLIGRVEKTGFLGRNPFLGLSTLSAPFFAFFL